MSAVRHELVDRVVVVTIDRPERRNAMNVSMLRDLHDAVASAAEVAEGIVITGSGAAFCSGQDLADRYRPAGAPSPDLGASLDENWNPLIRRIRSCPVPVVAAVNGVAAGAGANLAFAAHAVVAAESAWFSEAFVRVGLMPDCGGTWTVTRSVGRARALGSMLLGGRFDAAAAADWGLVARVVPDGTAKAAALEMVRGRHE